MFVAPQAALEEYTLKPSMLQLIYLSLGLKNEKDMLKNSGNAHRSH